MQEKNVLMTGYRLLCILAVLYENDASKKDLMEFFSKKYKIKDISNETLKLDINTLIKAGFNLTRGNKTNNYKIHLEKDFVMQKLTNEDFLMLNVVKDSALDFLNYRQILNVRAFYKRISNYIYDDFNHNLYDFKFFNFINAKILKEIEKSIENKSFCVFIYDSPTKGKIEIDVYPEQIICRNNKIYISCYSKNFSGRVTFRADKIKAVKASKLKVKKKLVKKNEKRKIRYKITKEYFKTHPLEKFEKVIKEENEKIEIETEEKDLFFVIQRLLTIGKNCSRLNNSKIKEKVLANLKDTLELYK